MRIPIHPPERIEAVRPDIVWILPWNLEREIAAQLAHIGDWGGRLFVAIPEPHLLDPAARHAESTTVADREGRAVLWWQGPAPAGLR